VQHGLVQLHQSLPDKLKTLTAGRGSSCQCLPCSLFRTHTECMTYTCVRVACLLTVCWSYRNSSTRPSSYGKGHPIEAALGAAPRQVTESRNSGGPSCMHGHVQRPRVCYNMLWLLKPGVKPTRRGHHCDKHPAPARRTCSLLVPGALCMLQVAETRNACRHPHALLCTACSCPRRLTPRIAWRTALWFPSAPITSWACTSTSSCELLEACDWRCDTSCFRHVAMLVKLCHCTGVGKCLAMS
jgi:hypothetical protein